MKSEQLRNELLKLIVKSVNKDLQDSAFLVAYHNIIEIERILDSADYTAESKIEMMKSNVNTASTRKDKCGKSALQNSSKSDCCC